MTRYPPIRTSATSGGQGRRLRSRDEELLNLRLFHDRIDLRVVWSIADRHVELLYGDRAVGGGDHEHPTVGELVSRAIDRQAVRVTGVLDDRPGAWFNLSCPA